jgi:hypothetical protein
MESEDYPFFQGLVYLLENDVSTLGYELTFSTEVGCLITSLLVFAATVYSLIDFRLYLSWKQDRSSIGNGKYSSW